MKKLISAFISVMAMLALASPLFAAGDYSTKSKHEGGSVTGTGQMSGSQNVITSPAELKGMKVVSQNGDDIGKIEKVTTDPQSGHVKFVTISKGGVLGMGGKDIAVPREAFRIDNTKQEVTLTVNESKLNNVPKQANMSDDEFQRNLERHYGVAPAFKGNTQKMGNEPSGSMDQNQMGTGSGSSTGTGSSSHSQ